MADDAYTPATFYFLLSLGMAVYCNAQPEIICYYMEVVGEGISWGNSSYYYYVSICDMGFSYVIE